MNWKSLRMRRLANRVTKREMAKRLGCSEPWLNLLELGHYHAPAREKWMEPYKAALEEAIAERRSAR